MGNLREYKAQAQHTDLNCNAANILAFPPSAALVWYESLQFLCCSFTCFDKN